MCLLRDAIERSYYVLSTIVFLVIGKKIWNVFFDYVLGPLLYSVDFKSFGKWAMVTGSTDGIGKEYARQLAAKGCNIILVSRSMDKLKAVATEIENEFKVQTKIVQVDFTESDNDTNIYGKINTEIDGLEIGVLVNNVGMSYPYPEYFLQLPDWRNLTQNLIRVNMMSVLRLCGLVLPGMVKRGKGIIINVSSGSSVIPSPMLTVYAATKAFVIKFSEGLSQEYRDKGIIVNCVTPGYVATKMSKFRKTTFFIPSAKSYVRTALSQVNTTWFSDGYFSHYIMHNALNTVKAISEDFVANITRKSLESSRTKILKKELNFEG